MVSQPTSGLNFLYLPLPRGSVQLCSSSSCYAQSFFTIQSGYINHLSFGLPIGSLPYILPFIFPCVSSGSPFHVHGLLISIFLVLYYFSYIFHDKLLHWTQHLKSECRVHIPWPKDLVKCSRNQNMINNLSKITLW